MCSALFVNQSKPEVVSRGKTDQNLANEIIAAIDGKDFSGASELIKEGIASKTLNASAPTVLGHLTEADLSEGSKISSFVANSLDEPGNVLQKQRIHHHVRAIMIKFGVCNDIKGLVAFVDSLSEIQMKYVSNTVNSAMKTAALLHNPTEYLRLIASDPTGETPKVWMVGTKAFRDAGEDTVVALEELAGEGNVAAVCSLCRAGLAREDRGLLERSWERLQDKGVWGPQIFSQPSGEEVEFFVKTMNRQAIGALFKNYLDNSNKLTMASLVTLTEAALSQTSIQLGDLENHTLGSLARSNNDYRAEARRVLKARAGDNTSAK